MEVLDDIRLFEDSDLPTLQLLHYKDGDFFLVFQELDKPDEWFYKVLRHNSFTESEIYSTILVAFYCSRRAAERFSS